MDSDRHSYLAIAALDAVRERLAAGNAIVVFHAELKRAAWANGQGAALLGYATIEALLAAEAPLGMAARRQIAATPGFPSIGSERSLVVRLPDSTAVAFVAAPLTLPGGEPAILLAASPARAEALDLVSGFAAPLHAAVLDGEGLMIAASPGADSLGLTLPAPGEGEFAGGVRILDANGRRLPALITALRGGTGRLLALVLDEDQGPERAPVAEPAPEPESEKQAGPAHQEPAPAPAARPGTPVRFIWRTDAEGRFTALSPEFTAAVGGHPADILGKPFREVAAALDLDPGGEVTALLERRDTWSGRSVLWPIAGESLRVPVDLAALPAYDRMRTFEGFRGFGVARMGDLVMDERPAGPGEPSAGNLPAVEDAPQPEAPPQSDAESVVSLAQHRAALVAERSNLTATERSTFREIGDRLKEVAGAVPSGDVAETASPAPEPEVAALEPSATPQEEEPAVEPEPSGRGGEGSPDPSAVSSAVPAAFLPSAFAVVERARSKAAVDTSILARLPLPVLIHSGDALHYANREFLDLTGYESVGDLARIGGLDRLFAAPAAEIGEGDRRMRLVKRDGGEIPVEARLQSVPWNGAGALMLAIRPAYRPAEAAQTVKAAAELFELRARLDELGAILDTATDGVVLIGNDGTIRSISRPAEALFGFAGQEAAGRPFVDLFAAESQRAARDYLAGLSEHGVASVLNDGREVIGREAEGGYIPLFMTIGRLPNESGYCAVLRDITPWKRAEEELTQARAQAERASSQKTEFLARVSHEVRTPLNAIIGFSELMMDEKFGPIGNGRYRDYLRDINRSGNHVLDLVNDLLDISKIEAGEQEMSYEAVSLNDTLAESVAMMQPQANRERVIIRSSFASRVPEVVADLRSVRQIALNLLSNAVRFTQAGGQVIVSTSYEPSGEVAMRVRDTGVGMSQAEIDQALKPFRQINALKRPRGDGTGLGLPLTKAMVEANRARFAIQSTPGEGTLVEVVFPATRVLAD